MHRRIPVPTRPEFKGSQKDTLLSLLSVWIDASLQGFHYNPNLTLDLDFRFLYARRSKLRGKMSRFSKIVLRLELSLRDRAQMLLLPRDDNSSHQFYIENLGKGSCYLLTHLFDTKIGDELS